MSMLNYTEIVENAALCIALKFIEFLKQKVNRFGKVLIESISTFTEKKANAYFGTLINFHSKKSLNRVKS